MRFELLLVALPLLLSIVCSFLFSVVAKRTKNAQFKNMEYIELVCVTVSDD